GRSSAAVSIPDDLLRRSEAPDSAATRHSVGLPVHGRSRSQTSLTAMYLFHPRMDFASEGQTEEQAKPFARTALQQRPESAGQCALGIPRKADMPQWQASRAETVQPRPLPP